MRRRAQRECVVQQFRLVGIDVPCGDARHPCGHRRVGEHAVEPSGCAVEHVRVAVGIEARDLVGEAGGLEAPRRVFAGVGVEVADQQRVAHAARARSRVREARQRAGLRDAAVVEAALQVALVEIAADRAVAAA